MVKTDEFTERYGDLLAGSYDCVDRIVLNAYYPRGHNPGGFRVWWRRWHQDSDEELDNAHLMRLAGRFARGVRAWAGDHGVPVIDCKAGERTPRIAEEYLGEHTVGVGVFMILVARAPAIVWKVNRSSSGVIRNLEKTRQFVNHYSFHIMDPAWGHLTIKMSGHPPFGRRSSSTATSTSPAKPKRAASASRRKATASLGWMNPNTWLRSQTPCPSPGL